MTDFRALLSELRRPQMLIRAARYGISDYRRDRDLKRLLNGTPPSPSTTGDAAYSIARHIEVLIALMAEVRLLPRAQMKA